MPRSPAASVPGHNTLEIDLTRGSLAGPATGSLTPFTAVHRTLEVGLAWVAGCPKPPTERVHGRAQSHEEALRRTGGRVLRSRAGLTSKNEFWSTGLGSQLQTQTTCLGERWQSSPTLLASTQDNVACTYKLLPTEDSQPLSKHGHTPGPTETLPRLTAAK